MLRCQSIGVGETLFHRGRICFSHFLQAASVDGIEIQFIHGREGFSEVRRVQDGLFRSGNVILIDAGETEKQGRRNHREFDDDP